METEISLFNPEEFAGGDGFAAILVKDGPSPNICREDTRDESDFLPLAAFLRATMFKAKLSLTAKKLGFQGFQSGG
jgi:hypothetical protein